MGDNGAAIHSADSNDFTDDDSDEDFDDEIVESVHKERYIFF